jgi:hypothetical protein
MKLSRLVTALCLGLTAVASAQTYTETETKTETKYVTVDGEVIRYEPGKVIVIRGADNKEVTYTLLPKVTVPKDVQVGRRVVLYTEPGTGGSTVVARVTTTAVTPEGNVKKTTEETRTKAGVSTKTTTTEIISGTVQAYESGKTLTILRSDGSKVTYTLTGESTVPADLVIGKTVTIEPIDGSDVKVAKTVTYTIVRE